MKNSLIAAIAVTIGCGGATVLGLIDDPTLTPMRMVAVVLLATAFGLAWGRVIWFSRQH